MGKARGAFMGGVDVLVYETAIGRDRDDEKPFGRVVPQACIAGAFLVELPRRAGRGRGHASHLPRGDKARQRPCQNKGRADGGDLPGRSPDGRIDKHMRHGGGGDVAGDAGMLDPDQAFTCAVAEHQRPVRGQAIEEARDCRRKWRKGGRVRHAGRDNRAKAIHQHRHGPRRSSGVAGHRVQPRLGQDHRQDARHAFVGTVEPQAGRDKRKPGNRALDPVGHAEAQPRDALVFIFKPCRLAPGRQPGAEGAQCVQDLVLRVPQGERGSRRPGRPHELRVKARKVA